MLLIFTTFAWLYRVIPFEQLGCREIVSGALGATLGVELGKMVFVFYISRVANLEAVYGSPSSVIVLLLWLYITAWVILFGAAFIAVHLDNRSTTSTNVDHSETLGPR